MHRNENFILRQVADMTIIVPVGTATERFPGMISVNDTGVFLWDMLETEQSVQSMSEALTEEYQVEREQAEADVKAFLAKLEQAGAVDGL